MVPPRALTIMHVIDSGGLYGAERVLLDLAAASRDRGHRVIVSPLVAPQDEADPLGDAARRMGLEAAPFALPDGLRVKAFGAVTAAARRERADVIHSHGYKANILLAMQRRAQRPCPVLATLHGWTASRLFSRMTAYETLERMLLGRLDCVVAVSPTLRARVPRLAGRGAVRVIPNGVAPAAGPRASPVDPRIAAFIEGHPAILAAGRLSAEKGFDALIRAMPIVAASSPDVRLVIAGDGPERPMLEALVNEQGLVDQVLMPGYIRNVRDIMERFRLYVLSSHREGLPAVLLEAMAEGLPIVSTAVGAIPEALGRGSCGRLLAPGDEQALGRAIADLLADPEGRARLARAAKERFAARYSSDTMAGAYQRLYRELAEGGQAAEAPA